MLVHDAVTQPDGKSNLGLIAGVLQAGVIDRLDVAAAYVTIGGALDLLQTMEACLGDRWVEVQKRWLIAFDYCRTEPLAAQMLLDAPQSSVKVHDGVRVVTRRCVPAVPFHPKTFIFHGPDRHAVFTGSGNVSRSGMNTGHEVGLLLDRRAPLNPSDVAAQMQIDAVQVWYNTMWNLAAPLDAALATSYKRIFNSVENLRQLVPTDDDVVPPSGTLTSKDLRKLRACSQLWIEAGNVTKNLGKDRPGNQLMMKRLSRVFFGVPANNVPQNSPLTTLSISYAEVVKTDCSLTFSDNAMDKLTLPVPGAGGPAAYDGETLLFTRIGAGAFRLDLCNAKQKNNLIQRSEAIDAVYTMPSGRQWGVL